MDMTYYLENQLCQPSWSLSYTWPAAQIQWWHFYTHPQRYKMCWLFHTVCVCQVTGTSGCTSELVMLNWRSRFLKFNVNLLTVVGPGVSWWKGCLDALQLSLHSCFSAILIPRPMWVGVRGSFPASVWRS